MSISIWWYFSWFLSCSLHFRWLFFPRISCCDDRRSMLHLRDAFVCHFATIWRQDREADTAGSSVEMLRSNHLWEMYSSMIFKSILYQEPRLILCWRTILDLHLTVSQPLIRKTQPSNGRLNFDTRPILPVCILGVYISSHGPNYESWDETCLRGFTLQTCFKARYTPWIDNADCDIVI